MGKLKWSVLHNYINLRSQLSVLKLESNLTNPPRFFNTKINAMLLTIPHKFVPPSLSLTSAAKFRQPIPLSFTTTNHRHHHHIHLVRRRTMACCAAVTDTKFGFSRPEMYKSNLANTVDAYDRHVFLCFQGPKSWAPRVEDSNTHLLPKLLTSAVKARKTDIVVKTKLTVCGGCSESTECSDGDVLIFPDMIKYKSLNEASVDSFVEDVLVSGKPWASAAPVALTGFHIFVCAHGSRDRRCGVCGTALIDKLKEEVESRGLKDQVFVSPCSHVGGHKYAGNLIIYSSNPVGRSTGHWYGYVTPDDIPELLDQHISKGQIIERLWRGQMGCSFKEEEKADEKKPLNKDNAKADSSKGMERS